MRPLDTVPAVRRLETDRSDVLAIEIAGPMTGADVENLYGLLEGAYALNDRIDLLVRWPDGEDVDWNGIASDTLRAARDEAAAMSADMPLSGPAATSRRCSSG